MSDLLKEAIEGLKLNVPIYHTVEQDGLLILYLYGGRVEHWPPTEGGTTGAGTFQEPTLATAGSDVEPDPGTTLETEDPELQDPPVTTDDFTVIPGIGKATAAALHKAGFLTFQDLIDSIDTQVLNVPKLNGYLVSKIRSYLYIHYL